MTDVRDTDAQFRRGMAILAESASGKEWLNGVALIESAAAAGHPDAAERCALFECMGIGRQPDWNKGLDWLVRAAESGSTTAGRALVLLAENRFAAALPEGQSAGYWSELRGRIPLGERLRPPAPHVLSPRPLILSFDGFASPAECQWLISAAERRLEPAFVLDRATGMRSVDPQRSNTSATFPVVEMDVIVEMMRARISAALHVPPPFLEVTQVLHYAVGQEFRPHHDFFDLESEEMRTEAERNGQRAATVLIYLNEGFEGGETRFPVLQLDYRGKTGDAVVFANVDPAGQPDPATLHAGLPPTTGEKWLLSQWVRDRPLGL